MQDGERVKTRREARQANDVSVQDNSSGVRPAAPISPGSPQYDLDQRLHYRHIFEMQKGEALPERLRFVLALQSQTQSRMHAAQPIFRLLLCYPSLGAGN